MNGVTWWELNLESDRQQAERLAELLDGSGAMAVTFRDAAAEALYEPAPGMAPMWASTRVTALFESRKSANDALDAVRQALPAASIAGPTVERLEDRDWEREWMSRFEPERFGHRLWVCPSWCTPPPDAEAVVMLDPGLAFGTGSHPTTALCLEWLDGHCRDGDTLVDYGCGSGILAIAAVRLGAREVWAVDHDPQALQATRDNAARNSVDQLHIMPPDAISAVQADTVIANILAGPLTQLAARLAALVRPGGRLLLSGILESQAAELGAVYARWFTLDVPQAREEWVRLAGVRRPNTE